MKNKRMIVLCIIFVLSVVFGICFLIYEEKKQTEDNYSQKETILENQNNDEISNTDDSKVDNELEATIESSTETNIVANDNAQNVDNTEITTNIDYVPEDVPVLTIDDYSWQVSDIATRKQIALDSIPDNLDQESRAIVIALIEDTYDERKLDDTMVTVENAVDYQNGGSVITVFEEEKAEDMQELSEYTRTIQLSDGTTDSITRPLYYIANIDGCELYQWGECYLFYLSDTDVAEFTVYEFLGVEDYGLYAQKAYMGEYPYIEPDYETLEIYCKSLIRDISV